MHCMGGPSMLRLGAYDVRAGSDEGGWTGALSMSGHACLGLSDSLPHS